MARTLVAMQQAHLGYWLESGATEATQQVIGRLQRQVLPAFCRPEVLADGRALLDAPSARSQHEARNAQ